VREVDGASAIRLYREWRTESGVDVLTRVHTAVELASLGDGEFLSEVVTFLENPPAVPERDLGRMRPLQERAIEVVSYRNYRPGLAALKALETGGPPYAQSWRWLPIYIAQLSGDHETVLAYASDPERFSWALRALKRMGRDDLLRKLADDVKYRFRGLARDLLTAEPNP
jgi:hypothetical protein